MSRIYSTTNRIKFTDIPEKYAIPRSFRAKQSEVHSAIVTYVFEHYKDTKKYRKEVVDALNRLTYCVMQNELPSFKWVSTSPIETMPDIDLDVVESALGGFYLTPEAIEWDVPVSQGVLDDSVISTPKTQTSAKEEVISSNEAALKSEAIPNRPLRQVREQRNEHNPSTTLTPKEDLYIQPPKFPRFDTAKVWMSADVGGDNLVIYTTLPEIPTKQNEVSITTDPGLMTDNEFMALYPNHIIHTRSQKMYDECEGVEFDPDLGCIIPIEGFSREQIVDNIVKYPHLYRLRRIGSDGNLQPLFSCVEIDGQLVPTSEVWDTLPESKILPRDSEFIKEYVIRRYLLERDNGVIHKYPMFGKLDPFLTLFMPCTKYIEKGYTDVLNVAKQCVTSRIHYKQSRSPILRRIEPNV